MRYLIVALLFLLCASTVRAGVFVGFGQGGGGTGGTLLVGDSSVTVSVWDATGPGQSSHYDQFTAAASGNIAKGYASLAAIYPGLSCKMMVYNSSGTIIATSAPASIPTSQSTVEFTFSSGSITASTTYYLGTTCDYYINRGHDGGEWLSGMMSDSYDTPGNISSPDATNPEMGNLRIWVTN